MLRKRKDVLPEAAPEITPTSEMLLSLIRPWLLQNSVKMIKGYLSEHSAR
ncbi:hypothetical protein Hsw_PA0068 (plasmid) [Hymenobacter swuensis DY53]|uniref:Uncharacterized protein n=1 Tax=Hymenobacter swuensis DY53 TaxID=1227739 RepID=W8EYH7_9BACT|nr:hypothetical protein Hsw_PA0068 [Hymenobacter swuensis DY53]